MKDKKITKEQVLKLEKAVQNGLYAVPGNHNKSNDNDTKEIIKKMKKRESSSFQEPTKI